jgi:hypothetical protein
MELNERGQVLHLESVNRGSFGGINNLNAPSSG